MAAVFIDSTDQVKDLISKIEHSDPIYPFLFIDLEGIDLSRHGAVSIMQILIGHEHDVHLIDIHQLQQAAFETESSTGMTLHKILESEMYPKVIFDVRTDSDALFGQYNINLRCTVDLQLLEFITRNVRGQFLSGLSKCIERDLPYFGGSEWSDWKRIKEAGRRCFAPEIGGSYEVLNERPLKQALVDYCVQDVKLMPRLLLQYAPKLRQSQAVQVMNETNARIRTSQGVVPLTKGRHMAIGPTFAMVVSLGQPIILSHPMDIICSQSLKEYCEPRETSNPPISMNPEARKSDETITGIPPPAPTPPVRTTTPGEMTVSRALEQLSSRRTPDFTVAEMNDDDAWSQDADQDSDDLNEVEEHLHDTSPRL